MDSDAQPDNQKILQLVGAIVLTSQEVEQCLKMALPYLANEDPNLGAALKRHERLKGRSLGELVGALAKASESDGPHFESYVAKLVEDRNRLVHHFNDTFGARLAAGAHKDVIAALDAQLIELRGFRTLTQHLALFVLEGLRDITFRDTPEYEQMVAVCASLRQRLAS